MSIHRDEDKKDDFDGHLSQMSEEQWEAFRALVNDLKAIVEKERIEKIQKENEEMEFK